MSQNGTSNGDPKASPYVVVPTTARILKPSDIPPIPALKERPFPEPDHVHAVQLPTPALDDDVPDLTTQNENNVQQVTNIDANVGANVDTIPQEVDNQASNVRSNEHASDLPKSPNIQ